MCSASPNVTSCTVFNMRFCCKNRVSSCVGCVTTRCLPNIGFRDNKKLKQGHFEMGICCANFMPISNRCARRRATLCPLAKCYQERHQINILVECMIRNIARSRVLRRMDDVIFQRLVNV